MRVQAHKTYLGVLAQQPTSTGIANHAEDSRKRKRRGACATAGQYEFNAMRSEDKKIGLPSTRIELKMKETKQIKKRKKRSRF
jgi:hypothetical protein